MQGRKKQDRQGTAGKLRPYFERDGLTLYYGESLQLMTQLDLGIADAIITDPPYCSGGLTTADRTRDPVEKYCHSGKSLGRPTFSGDMRDQRSFGFWATLWMSESRRLCKESAYSLVFTDWRQLPTMSNVLQAGGFVWRGIIAWGTNGRCRKAVHAGPFDGCINETVRQKDKHHITGKPTNLMKQLVECVPPGGLVIDLFGGSGTTAVACALSGRRCIITEQSEEYCEIAAKRVERAIDEHGLAAAA